MRSRGMPSTSSRAVTTTRGGWLRGAAADVSPAVVHGGPVPAASAGELCSPLSSERHVSASPATRGPAFVITRRQGLPLLTPPPPLLLLLPGASLGFRQLPPAAASRSAAPDVAVDAGAARKRVSSCIVSLSTKEHTALDTACPPPPPPPRPSPDVMPLLAPAPAVPPVRSTGRAVARLSSSSPRQSVQAMVSHVHEVPAPDVQGGSQA
mmetsp:Transcript_35802/g.79671  ORF Transcript_35802/g.79671 Transcript_35802/m.79671 type:complete len:209 (+) Transcript_35802:1325-1951(+)